MEFVAGIREEFVLRRRVVMIVENGMSLVKLVVTSTTSRRIVSHRGVVISPNLAVALTRTHHSKDLRETLAILEEMI